MASGVPRPASGKAFVPMNEDEGVVAPTSSTCDVSVVERDEDEEALSRYDARTQLCFCRRELLVSRMTQATTTTPRTYAFCQCQLRQQLYKLAFIAYAQVQRQVHSVRLHRVPDIEPSQSLDALTLVIRTQHVVDLHEYNSSEYSSIIQE